MCTVWKETKWIQLCYLGALVCADVALLNFQAMIRRFDVQSCIVDDDDDVEEPVNWVEITPWLLTALQVRKNETFHGLL